MKPGSRITRAAAPSLSIAMLGMLAPPIAPALSASDGVAAHVVITNSFRFEPSQVTIHAGEAIEWTNQSHFKHTVTDDPKMAGQPVDAALPAEAQAFTSDEIPAGGSYRRKLTVPGAYRYFCMPHEGIGMLGKILVLPGD